jgi:hypothetical protein
VATKKSQGRKPWTLDDEIRLLGDSAKLASAQLSAFLEREGLLLAELEQWRQALGDEMLNQPHTP